MENYHIPFISSEREAVLNILSTSNDIIINNIDDSTNSIGITIQCDDAEVFYHSLLARIDEILHSSRQQDVSSFQEGYKQNVDHTNTLG